MEARNHINGQVNVGLGGMKSGQERLQIPKYPRALHRSRALFTFFFFFLNANTTS